MKLAYYMPFKPMGHPHPSGDLMIGTELFNYIEQEGHDIELMSTLRCRWIYAKPIMWPKFLREYLRIIKKCRKEKPDIWLSYHSYYKAPDLLGCLCAQQLNIPYIIFQGVYSTKRKKKLTTLPGFLLNRYALNSAQLVITNKYLDKENLLRLLPKERLLYIAPGIHPNEFCFSASARKRLRQQYNLEGKTVIMTAAMFRPGVKTEGITQVINACHQLQRKGHNLALFIAGDGSKRQFLEEVAKKTLKESCYFLGKIPRHELFKYYSGADIFTFPGINESLGMVYIEAQACRLPVVALQNWGAKEAVVHNHTGLLSDAKNASQFRDNIEALLKNPTLCNTLARNAEKHVMTRHNLKFNYSQLVKNLQELI